MKLTVRLLLMALGVGVFLWFASRANFEEIFAILSRLGWLGPLILLPYAGVYVMDCFAWTLVFQPALRIGFWRLFRIRWIGEAVNYVVPTAYVGGEAVKTYLLHKQGVALRDGATAAVVSKTAQTVGQVAFIGLAALAFVRISPGHSALQRSMILVLAISMAIVTGLLWLQQRGMFATLLRIVGGVGLRLRALETRRERLLRLDNQIARFYREDRRRFFRCATAYLGGWLLDPMEIFLVAHLMGLAISWWQALAVEAFIGVARIIGLFVPGALGVQETGVVFLCRLAGLPDSFGFAYAILRRGRELFFAGIGWTLFYLEEASLRTLRTKIGSVKDSV